MKRLFFTLLPVLCLLTAIAQPPAGNAAQFNVGRFYGKIVDAKSGKPIEAASVQLFGKKLDPVTRTMTDTLYGGMLTGKNGDFSLTNLPVMGKFSLEISAIGYKTITVEAAFDLRMGQGDPAMAMAAIDKDLGNIKMEEDPEILESVTVTGTKPMLQLGIDRKIFNVEKDISSAGGSAVDVMRNVPTVNVDIEGNVTLRNTSPQIFVDGRITTLTLDQIPADAIESIELITNPSAKFDASGGQSGIINIVLKKQRKMGYNGGIRAGIDSRGKGNFGGDINLRQGKVNFFASGMVNQRKSKGEGESIQDNLYENTKTKQLNKGTNEGLFAFGRFGIDYFVDNRNTVSLAQSFMGGNFDNENLNDYYINNLNNSTLLESQYRNTLSEFKMRNATTTLSYKHLFATPGKELTADINYNKSRSENEQDILFRSFSDLQMNNPISGENLQRITGNGKNNFITGQLDYINPINENMKWEAGVRGQKRTFYSSQYNFLNGTPKTNLDNEFEYSDYVYAGYATFSQKINEKTSYQVGLRAESSKYEGTQLGKASYENKFPISLFPSIFLTRQIADNQDIQVNYSRRINRPSFYQLMPNTDYSDPLNYQTGNPDLKPEFTNSLEISYQNTYGAKRNTFLATLFGKYTDNLISRYQERKQLAESDTIAFVSTWINANTAYAGGLELVFRNNLAKWWEMNLNTNIYYSKIDGANVNPNLQNDQWSSFTKLNNIFKIKNGWSIQWSADYQTKSALPVSTSNSGGGRGGMGRGGFMGGSAASTQGYIGANFGMDLGLRKDFKIKGNQANISLNMNDILATRKFIMYSESAGFVQDTWRIRDRQILRLNFSYRFGKFDAALFKRKNMRSGMDDGMNDGMMQMQ